jgi:hypothetical protein
MVSPGSRETRPFAAEIKFLIPRAMAVGVRDWARRHLDPDPHGTGPFGDEYSITTLYLDTPRYDVFHRRASFGRSKYRIRRYDHGPDVFLERKLRRPGVLAKRRTPVPGGELLRLERDDVVDWEGRWFHRRMMLRGLRPVCELSYHRVARQGGSASGPIRLTLDDDLRALRSGHLGFTGGDGVPFATDQVVLELKFRAEVPAAFKRLVEEFGLQPQAASKYRMGIAAVDPDGTRGAGAASAPAVQDAAGGLSCA